MVWSISKNLALSSLPIQSSTTRKKRYSPESTQQRFYLCQEQEDILNDISDLRSDLQLSGYPEMFTDSVLTSRRNIRPEEEKKALRSVIIPYVKGISEKFKRIGNRYNIRTVFRTKHTLRSSLMKTRPERCPLKTAHCVCSIPCECGRSYIGETGRPSAVQIREHS
jgi:hypothetical protein